MNKDYFIWAKTIIGQDFEIKTERGQENNMIFRLEWNNESAFLKVGKNLIKEKLRLEWLDGRINSPRVIGFQHNDEYDYLLISTIIGVDLAHLAKKWDSQKVVTKLADSLRNFHDINLDDCPFGDKKEGDVLIHGDACLPNIIYHEDGNFSGYIDLGDLTVGNREIDLAASIWSLQFNLGKGYGLSFLRKYGIPDADEIMVDRLYSQY